MDILAELNNVFRQVFDDSSLTVSRTTTANDIDEWDSLTHMNLVVAVDSRHLFNQVDFASQVATPSRRYGADFGRAGLERVMAERRENAGDDVGAAAGAE